MDFSPIIANLTQGIGFIHYIKSFTQPVFSATQVAATHRALKTGRRVPTLATHREHVQILKRRIDPTAERLVTQARPSPSM